MSRERSMPPELPTPIPEGHVRTRVEREFWPKLKRVIGRVPGLADVLALYYYLNSDRAPLRHKMSIVATLAYFIVPVDAIPDFLGPMGYMDDLAVAMGLIGFIGSETMAPYRIYARKWLRGDVGPELDLETLDEIDVEAEGQLIEVKASSVERERGGDE